MHLMMVQSRRVCAVLHSKRRFTSAAPAGAWPCHMAVLVHQLREACEPGSAAEGREADLVVIGEKGRAQLIRDQRDHIAAVIQDVGKVRITFSQVQADATCIAAEQGLRPTAGTSQHASRLRCWQAVK